MRDADPHSHPCAYRLALALLLAIAAMALAAGPAAAAGKTGDGVPFGPEQIVNGSVAPPGTWPFISYDDGCGGSLIAPRWILSAAHCDVPASVVLGRHDLADESVGEEIGVVRGIRHPSYSPSSQVYDFMLLQLGRASTQPTIPLATAADDPLGGENVFVAGWGEMAPRAYPDELRHATLRAVSDSQCRSAWGGDFNSSVMLCALFSNGALTRDTCAGDSGGPLTTLSDAGTEVLAGVTSWGADPCGQPGAPGVYSRVSAARGWILNTVGGGGSSGPDTTAPQTVAGARKAQVRIRRSARTAVAIYDFSSSEAGSTFTCSVNGQSFGRCTSPFAVRVPKGRFTLSVAATDRAGNRDPSPATATVRARKRR